MAIQPMTPSQMAIQPMTPRRIAPQIPYAAISVKRVVPWEKNAQRPNAPPARPLPAYNAKINLTVRREGSFVLLASAMRPRLE